MQVITTPFALSIAEYIYIFNLSVLYATSSLYSHVDPPKWDHSR